MSYINKVRFFFFLNKKVSKVSIFWIKSINQTQQLVLAFTIGSVLCNLAVLKFQQFTA